MKKTAVLLSCLATIFSVSAHADVVIDWNSAALDAIRALSTSPPAASRNLAILHIAVYDAVNGIERRHQPYHVQDRAPSGANKEAAASAAARAVMNALYPTRQAENDTLHAAVLGGIRNGQAKARGVQWGEQVAAAILALRSNDGSANTAPFPGSQEPGQWRPTESFGGIVRPALLPLWGLVTPFALTTGSQLRPPPPPALHTEQYAEEVNFVKAYGATNSAVRTRDETQIAQFWAYGAGTSTPPGHWNQIAQVVARSQRNSLGRNARMFALLNISLADAAISCWDCKYLYNYWRPITAIQLADTDGNPATEPDPAWKPLLFTPPFPEYTSGHSTFSGAGAAALAVFFGRDRIRFSVGSDDLPGVVRHYRSFSHAAEESGMSRIFGGIHFMSANVYGLESGANVGEHVVRNLLGRIRAGGHGHDDDDDRGHDDDDGGGGRGDNDD